VAVLEALGEAEPAADLAWEYGFHLAWQYRPRDILTVTRRALEALEGKPAALRCRVLAMMGMGFSEDGQFDEAAVRLDDARKMAEAEGDTRLLGEVGTVETVHHAIWMQFRESESAGRRAAAMLREAGALWNLADALAFLDQALVFQGKFAESDAVVEEAAPLAARVGHYAAASVLGRRNGLAKVAAQSGNLDELEAMSTTQFAVSTDMGSSMWLAHANSFRGMVLFWQGDWDGARTFLEEGARLAPPGLWFGPHHGLLLLLHAHLGEADRAFALLDSVALPETGRANMIGTWTLGLMAAEAVSILGDERRAGGLYPVVCEALDTGAVLRQAVALNRAGIAGMAAATAHDHERAEEHFERATAQATALPHMVGRPMVRWSYGAFLLARGRARDRDRAATLLDQAVAEFAGLGMPRHEALARRAGRFGD